MKPKRFKVDDWVLYCQFPNSHYDTLKEERLRSVVLEVLDKNSIYDYRIFIDNGNAIVRKVQEENLFPCDKTK